MLNMAWSMERNIANICRPNNTYMRSHWWNINTKIVNTTTFMGE